MKEILKQKLQEAKTDLVLQAVSDYFDRRGFSEPTMQEIAAAVGLSVGALYKLFPSKEALFFAYISYQIRHFHQELLLHCIPLASSEERLLCYIRLKFRTFVSKRKAIEDPVLGDPLFFVKMNTRRENPAEPIYTLLAEQFRELSRELPLRCDDHLKIAYLFNSHTMGYIEYWLNFGGDLESRADEAYESFIHGVAR
ncbi:TetR/AcrR family transcriptional regulator [Nitratifractor sp.]